MRPSMDWVWFWCSYIIHRDGVARVKPLKSTCFSISFPPFLRRAFITSNESSWIFGHCPWNLLNTTEHGERLSLSTPKIIIIIIKSGLIIGFPFFGTLCKRSVEWNSWFVYHSCNSTTYGLHHSLPCHSYISSSWTSCVVIGSCVP